MEMINEYQIVTEGDNKFYYLSDNRRVKFDLTRVMFSKCILQDRRTLIRKTLFGSRVVIKWVDVSYFYESQFVNNMSGLIDSLERAAKRAWGGRN